MAQAAPRAQGPGPEGAGPRPRRSALYTRPMDGSDGIGTVQRVRSRSVRVKARHWINHCVHRCTRHTGRDSHESSDTKKNVTRTLNPLGPRTPKNTAATGSWARRSMSRGSLALNLCRPLARCPCQHRPWRAGRHRQRAAAPCSIAPVPFGGPPSPSPRTRGAPASPLHGRAPWPGAP